MGNKEDYWPINIIVNTMVSVFKLHLLLTLNDAMNEYKVSDSKKINGGIYAENFNNGRR